MGKASRRIRVFLVDDHPLVREGVRSFLSTHAIVVVGEASNAKDALRKVKKLAPDIVVLDVNLPEIDGGELARRLRRLVPETKLIAFSIHAGAEFVVKMARSGVQGYVAKAQPAGELLEAIRRVQQGGLHFPAGMNDALLAPARGGDSESGKGELTGREREVLGLIAEGHSNKEIAGKLGISVRTSETHRENLSRKLNILTIAGLTKYALKEGLTALGPSAAP
jgi:DNA-binding NarL/FixJ family response regulator